MSRFSILFVVPARGGSKGIPRKNLRTLNKKPLITYVLKMLGSISCQNDVRTDICLSSDDEEILSYGRYFSIEAVKRGDDLSSDDVTLDAVVFHALNEMEAQNNLTYDYVASIQPTSPLLDSQTIKSAIQILQNGAYDNLISVTEERHLSWIKEGSKYIKNYKERKNRQNLETTYKETGSFIFSKREIVTSTNRFGDNIEVYPLNEKEGIDIDSYSDWAKCEYFIKKSNIIFLVKGYKEIGYGHVYRSLSIANSILNHNVSFIFDNESREGYEIVKANNFECSIIDKNEITIEILGRKPDLVINDILDTDEEYIAVLKKSKIKVINFEDLGQGAQLANIVVNALYPEKEVFPNHYYGSQYFIARDEFLLNNKKVINENASNILITFGGTDPNNLTLKVLETIYPMCVKNGITITAILTSFRRSRRFQNKYFERR